MKLSPDGALIWSTLLGGSGKDTQEASIRVDAKKRVAIVLNTQSSDFPITPGASGRRLAGPNDIAIVKLSPSGALLRSTLIGGNGQDGADGIDVDSDGNVFFAGQTSSTDFPTTPVQYVRRGTGAS